MLLQSEQCLVYGFYCAGACGLLVNAMLLLIILNKKSIRTKDYASFVINRAVADVFLNLQQMTLDTTGIYFWDDAPIICKIAGGMFNQAFYTGLFSEVCLAMNRYVSVCHKSVYSKIYKRRNIYIFCVLTWAASALAITPHIFADSLGKTPGFYCTIKHERRFVLLESCLDYSIFSSCIGVVIFFYCKVFLALKKYMAQETNRQILSRLREDKALLRFVGTSAVLPATIETPAGITSYLLLFNVIPHTSMVPVGFGIVFFFTPCFNGIMTMIMLRPVRKELRRILRKFFPGNTVSIANQPNQQP